MDNNNQNNIEVVKEETTMQKLLKKVKRHWKKVAIGTVTAAAGLAAVLIVTGNEDPIVEDADYEVIEDEHIDVPFEEAAAESESTEDTAE